MTPYIYIHYLTSTSQSTTSTITTHNSTTTVPMHIVQGTFPPITQTDPTRKSAPLEFNAYINASDRLEEFIRYLGTLGLRQSEVLDLPLNLFITWLIIEAARFDGEQDIPEESRLIEDLREVKAKQRCRWCGRFLANWKIERGIQYCHPEHFKRFLDRAGQRL